MSSVKEIPSETHAPDAAHARAAVEAARQRLQAGDPDGAAAALREVATRGDAPPAELADAAKILADAGAPAEAVGRYLESGRGYLAAGDAGRARTSFAAAYEIDGKNLDALFELGRADVADGKRHDALDKFVEVLRKSNLKHLPALYEAGCLYELDGQHNQAILAFKRVVEREKTHAQAFEHLAHLHHVRNQNADAVGYYQRAAEAAYSRSQYADAKRLAEAALDIDGSNAGARRVLADADKALSGSPPEAAAPGAAAEKPAAPKPVVSDVTPVAPPTADGAAPPPPPPSTLNIAMPPDVALLEQQSQAMAQLAQVQSAVAQTYKQRLVLEEEIKRAQAALEALQRQQQSVDDDLSGKRDELARVISERETEEATLAALGDAIAKSKSELAALSDIASTVEQARAQCASAGEAAAAARSHAESLSGQSAQVQSAAADAGDAVGQLRAKLDAARSAADALDRQHQELTAGLQAAHETAKVVAGQADSAHAAADALAGKHDAVKNAGDQLAAVEKTVQEKLAQAQSAIARLEALQAQRSSQFDEIVFKLTPLVGDMKPAAQSAAKAPAQAAAPAAPAQPAAAQPAAAPPPQAAAPPAKAAGAAAAQAPASLDDLIGTGKFDEAVRRAQTEANAQPKPADYLIDAGVRLSAAGRLDDAIKLFAAARDRDNRSARARYELGCAYAAANRFDEALSALRSTEDDPTYCVRSQVTIGKCLRMQGDLEAAEACFSKALEIEGHPEDEYHQALYELADLHESKGDPESLGLALWSWEELQNAKPNDAEVAERVAQLKSRLADAGVRSEPARNGAVKQ